MRNLSAAALNLVKSACIIIVIGVSGCSHTTEISSVNTIDKGDDVDYSVIYYIHADGDYLFHDAEGQAIRANSHVLESAKQIAANAVSGEVFIFYQRPEKKTLGLFPRNNSQFFHYKNGRIKDRISYRYPGSNETFLSIEADLYTQHRVHAPDNEIPQYFLYFGHEIPKSPGKSYHQSRPEISVSPASLAKGIGQFLSEENQQFDLFALSTCNNGTPAAAKHLTPLANYLLASPQNLHLSHIDSEPLGLLEDDPGISPQQMAQALANQTYERLSTHIRTAVTLAVYDLNTVQSYINELDSLALEYKSSKHSTNDNTDCAHLPFFDDEKYKRGVDVWYQSAQFGRGADIKSHSGWGCRHPLKDRGSIRSNTRR